MKAENVCGGHYKQVYKVETIRGAFEYLKRLKELLGEEIDDTPIADIKFEEDESKNSTFCDMLDSPIPPPPVTNVWSLTSAL